MLWNRLKHGDRLVIKCTCGQEHQIAHSKRSIGWFGIGMAEVRRTVKRLTRSIKSVEIREERKT